LRALLVTVNAYTQGQDFRGVPLVVDQLGEPARPARALVGDLAGQPLVDLALLDRLHRAIYGSV